MWGQGKSDKLSQSGAGDTAYGVLVSVGALAGVGGTAVCGLAGVGDAADGALSGVGDTCWFSSCCWWSGLCWCSCWCLRYQMSCSKADELLTIKA